MIYGTDTAATIGPRDYLAAAVMPALMTEAVGLSNAQLGCGDGLAARQLHVAECAYQWADALMVARKATAADRPVWRSATCST